MDQAGFGDEFLELGHKWCMGIVHDVTSQYHIMVRFDPPLVFGVGPIW